MPDPAAHGFRLLHVTPEPFEKTDERYWLYAPLHKHDEQMLILNEHEVEQLLTMRECIEVMEQALASLARGEVHNPLAQRRPRLRARADSSD